jgi:hypothetical protein
MTGYVHISRLREHSLNVGEDLAGAARTGAAAHGGLGAPRRPPREPERQAAW